MRRPDRGARADPSCGTSGAGVRSVRARLTLDADQIAEQFPRARGAACTAHARVARRRGTSAPFPVHYAPHTIREGKDGHESHHLEFLVGCSTRSGAMTSTRSVPRSTRASSGRNCATNGSAPAPSRCSTGSRRTRRAPRDRAIELVGAEQHAILHASGGDVIAKAPQSGAFVTFVFDQRRAGAVVSRACLSR